MSISSDVELLQDLIKLPAPPHAVHWVKESRPGGRDFTLTAVLQYEPEAVARIAEGSQAFDVQPSVRLHRDVALALLPKELHGSLGTGEMVTLQGTAFQPNLFINPEKSALIHGRVLVMKAEGVVLVSLFTM